MDKRSADALQIIYMQFRERGGQWPTFVDFDRLLGIYGKPDAVQVINRIPSEFLKPPTFIGARPDPETKLILTVAGVRQCGGSNGDIRNIVPAIQCLVRCATKYEISENMAASWVPISLKRLTDELDLPLGTDRHSAERLIALLKVEGLVMSVDDEANRDCLYINPEIKRFRNVTEIDEYLKAASRDQRSRTRGAGRSLPYIFKRLRSWSISDKLTLAAFIIGVLGLAGTVLALLITYGVHIL